MLEDIRTLSGADDLCLPDETLQLWGGVECSVVRVGDDYRDQLRETGHDARMGDLDLIAGLGIRTVRYPALWERVAPDSPETCDWRWTDARLARLRALGIAPILGLVHHGAGPRYTSLIDPGFPDKLAAYAARVAERYPWVDRWTPVNEPLTTARFSALYGHWHPHTRCRRAFARAVVNQCLGVARAMAAVRRVNPAARLIQTEDLGRVFATAALQEQAAHENSRRWLSLDLLAGRVTRDHPWHAKLIALGAGEAELAELAGGGGRPDIIGINHYPTSDRFLDERADRYPWIAPGGDGPLPYIDTEAVRVPEADGLTGPAARLREAWARYQSPIAITESHIGCTREEQLRWLVETWNAARTLRREGADVRAVTLWSIFGAVDWCSLLTRRAGRREPGLFDLSGPTPRRTLTATGAAGLAADGAFDHPVLATPGWWRRPARFHGAPAVRSGPVDGVTGRPILITGATGTLGRAFARIAAGRGLAHALTARAELDIADPASITAAIDRLNPWAVVNTAGFVRVADAERERERCFRENADGPAALATVCAAKGLPFVTFSSDLVFDGRAGRAYREPDAASPAEPYGESKREAERRVLAAMPDALVIRTSAFFGPWDRYNFVWGVLDRLGRGETVEADDGRRVSPTYVPDLVHATLDLVLDGEGGLWHLANTGEVSWCELAREAAARAGVARPRIEPRVDVRANNALTTVRGLALPPLEQALERYFGENEVARAG